MAQRHTRENIYAWLGRSKKKRNTESRLRPGTNSKQRPLAGARSRTHPLGSVTRDRLAREAEGKRRLSVGPSVRPTVFLSPTYCSLIRSRTLVAYSSLSLSRSYVRARAYIHSLSFFLPFFLSCFLPSFLPSFLPLFLSPFPSLLYLALTHSFFLSFSLPFSTILSFPFPSLFPLMLLCFENLSRLSLVPRAHTTLELVNHKQILYTESVQQPFVSRFQ